MTGPMLAALHALSLVLPAIWEELHYFAHLTDKKSDVYKKAKYTAVENRAKNQIMLSKPQKMIQANYIVLSHVNRGLTKNKTIKNPKGNLHGVSTLFAMLSVRLPLAFCFQVYSLALCLQDPFRLLCRRSSSKHIFRRWETFWGGGFVGRGS